jgi:hypothetical protein
MLQKEISELKRKSDPLNKSKSVSTQKTSTSIQNVSYKIFGFYQKNN